MPPKSRSPASHPSIVGTHSETSCQLQSDGRTSTTQPLRPCQGRLPLPSRPGANRQPKRAIPCGPIGTGTWKIYGLIASQMVNAHADEIALVPNTTAGIGIVAEGFPWKAGDNVVTLSNEFPSNLYPWMNLHGRGVETRQVSVEKGQPPCMKAILDACDERTRIVTISWVGFATGYRIRLPRVGRCRPQQRRLAVSGRNTRDWASSPWICKAYPSTSWPLTVTSGCWDRKELALLYVRKEHLDRLRAVGVGWNSVSHRYDFDRVQLQLKPTAARYEGGTYNTGGLIGLRASLKLLHDLGVTPQQSPVADRILEITDYACETLQAAGAEIVSNRDSDQRSGIVAFRVGQDHDQLRSTCLQQGIVLSHRGGCLRISPHAYNNEDDVDRLAAIVRSARSS